MSSGSIDTSIPADAGVKKERTIPTVDGPVTVRSLRVSAVWSISAAVTELGFVAIPGRLDVSSFLSDEERAHLKGLSGMDKLQAIGEYMQGLAVQDRLLIEQKAKDQMQAILHYVAGAPKLSQVILQAMTKGLSTEQVGDLEFIDVLNIASASLEMTDPKALVVAFTGFFKANGGLMELLGAPKPAARDDKESPEASITG